LSSGIAIQTNLPTHHSDQHTDYDSDHYDDRHQSQLGNDEYFEAYRGWSHPPDPVYKEIVPSYKEIAQPYKEIVPGYSNPEPDGVTPPSTIYYGDTLAPKEEDFFMISSYIQVFPIRIGVALVPLRIPIRIGVCYISIVCFRTSNSNCKFLIRYD
jgi:hypothetical protein